MATARDLITASLRKAGIITMQETPSANMMNRALYAMNNMISSWSNDGVNVFTRTWQNFPLAQGQLAYTIGKGASDFDTERPASIAAAYVRLGIIDYPMAQINDEIYATQISNKLIAGIPKWFDYDNAFPIATFRIWPIPSADYVLYLLAEKALSDFSLDDTVSLPSGWERAIIFNLCDELCGDYGVETPDSVQRTAQKSFSLIRQQVQRQRSLDKYPQAISSSNIYSGWYT